MSKKHDQLEAIFNAALEFSGPERELYLARACGNDASLRQRVEKLLRALEKVGGFLGDAEGEAVSPAVAPSGESHATWLMPVTEQAGDRIGPYKLLERLGEGGCGVVYVAAQEEPVRRRVALKLIKLGMDTKSVLARFEAERQALALMEHPNIAKVFDAGATETGRPFFVMELVRGLRITDYCDQNNLPTHKRLELFIHVCHAIQHAHQKGIIHRDIKPSNILVTLHDGVPVPKVIDFGIAKATEGRLTDATLYTQLHQFIGTPAYMSPEQAEMSGLDMDTRSDIYSLGVLLYELLTGRTPFDANELMSQGIDVMRQTIREREPLRPSTRVAVLKGEERTTTAKRRSAEAPKLITLLKGDLDWIAMKCLEKDRARRYETANGLALDIERHLKSEPVLARPPSTVYRVQKFVRRNRLIVSAGAAVAAALVLGVTVSTWLAVRERQHRERAEASEQQALRMQVEAETAQAREHDQRELAEAHAYAADMNLAHQTLLAGNLGYAEDLLDRYRPGTGLEHLRGFEWRYLAAQARGDVDAMDTSSEEWVTGIALSPDGRRLAVSRRGGTIELRDPATLEVKRRLETKAHLFSCGAVFSSQGNLLAASSEGGVIRLWRSDTLELVRELPNSHAVLCLRFTPDGRHLAAFLAPLQGYWSDGEVQIWDVQSGEMAYRKPGFIGFAYPSGQLCFSPDGRHLAVGDPSGRIRILDWISDKEVTSFFHGDRVICLAYSPDGQLLASGSGFAIRSIQLWHPLTGEPLGQLEGHTGWVSDLVFSPDGRRLFSSGDSTIRIWDIATRQTLRTLRGHRREVHRLALSDDGDVLFSGSKEGGVARWDMNTEARRDSLVETPDISSWRQRRLLEDGRSMAYIAGFDGAVAIYNFANGPRGVVLHALGTWNNRLWVAQRRGMVACQNQHGIVEFWCLRRRLVIAAIVPEVDREFVGGFHDQDNRFLMIESLAPDRLQARVWDTQSWQELRRVVLNVPPIPLGWERLSISPDGRTILRWSIHAGSKAWLDMDQEPKLSEIQHAVGVHHMAFSPDGGVLASSNLDQFFVSLWDVDARQPKARLTSRLPPSALAFSPDGSRLAIGHMGGVTLRDLKTDRELMTVGMAGAGGWDLQFSADGSSLLSGPEFDAGPYYSICRPPSLAELDGEVDGGESMEAETQRETLRELVLTLERRPQITHQPEPMLLETGGTAEFRVQVAGEGLWICQWQHDGVDLPGATNTLLRLENVSLRHAGEYQALILSATEPRGRFAVSEPASLQVREGSLRYGALRLETYAGIPGVLVSDLTNHHTFPDQPDSIETIGRFEIPSDRALHYGARLTGYLTPPVTGDYVFYLASDDESRLYLSSNEDAGQMRAVAWEVLSAPRQWRRQESSQSNEPGNVSSPVPLEAGRRYYVEVLYKQDLSRDFLAVAWQLPGEPPPALGAPPIAGRYLACDHPGKADVEITAQPGDQSVLEYRTATFSVQATGRDSLGGAIRLYQWQTAPAGSEEFTSIAGATQATYTTPAVMLADDGRQYRVVIQAAPLVEFSEVATLTVLEDTEPPVLISGAYLPGSGAVGVLFSEPVKLDGATFRVEGAEVVSSEVVAALPLSVVRLNISGTPETGFEITVNNIKDLADNVLESATVTGQISEMQAQDIIRTRDAKLNATDPIRPGKALTWGDGSYFVAGGGSDIWDNADACHFVYRQWTGAFDMIANLGSFTGTHQWAKANVMARESLAGGSRQVNTTATRSDGSGQNNFVMEWRGATGGSSGGSEGMTAISIRDQANYPNTWIRLVREDANANVFRAYWSNNGVDWNLLHTHTMPGTVLPETLFVGMGITSHDNHATAPLAEAVYRQFNIQRHGRGVGDGEAVSGPSRD